MPKSEVPATNHHLKEEIFPFASTQNFTSHFADKTGKFILTNVNYNDKSTTVFMNKRGTSGSWRCMSMKQQSGLNFENPPFKVTSKTGCLTYNRIKSFGTYFEIVKCKIPESMRPTGIVSFDGVTAGSDVMSNLLSAMHGSHDSIGKICDSLQYSVDTPILEARREWRHPELCSGNTLSEYGKSLLKRFEKSIVTYNKLPQLVGFGTENTGRSSEKPNKRDAMLRHYMQQFPENPLKLQTAIDFISYELKPLNIADKLYWNCRTDPRTDSIDLLLAEGDCPVITEVKMAGDGFATDAIVQILYYGSILASCSQRPRLTSQFSRLGQNGIKLCIILECRNNQSERNAFSNNFSTATDFLKHEETARVLGAYFKGVIVLRVKEYETRKFCTVENGEIRIDW